MKYLYTENYKTLMKKIEKGTNILCPCVSEQAWGAGGVNDILLLNGPTLVLQGSSPPHCTRFALQPGKDVSQCQRLVKMKGIIYLKSYTDLE